MIQKATLQFLTELKKHNDKEWFDANRKKYESAKDDIQQLTQQLIDAIGAFDSNIAVLQPKECTFRINRDVRFSKNKAPYKTNMAAYFAKGGKKSTNAGYYLHIEPGASFLAAGCWGPEPAKLAAIRQEIDYNFSDWNKLVTSKTFTQTFKNGLSQEQVLLRPPKGYDEHNLAIQYLKLKGFIVTQTLDDALLTSTTMVKEITKMFKVAQPFVDFLNTAE
ncbi:DUF2461 domain-containing protein [Ferruginibacter yonginensis]|uniref:DUF2461 domain-containing protein n=1 Tax=Ferruginibacter yonginensis TaxID=1310416 RepID=A0ABV8QRG8_9BACT